MVALTRFYEFLLSSLNFLVVYALSAECPDLIKISVQIPINEKPRYTFVKLVRKISDENGKSKLGVRVLEILFIFRFSVNFLTSET